MNMDVTTLAVVAANNKCGKYLKRNSRTKIEKKKKIEIYQFVHNWPKIFIPYV